MGSLADM